MVASDLMGKFRQNPLIKYRDKPYTKLKPGQESMDRDFYAQATHEAPNGKIVLSNYGRFESSYAQNIAKTVATGDYQIPLKNNNTMCKI
jgi:hypothetical protein